MAIKVDPHSPTWLNISSYVESRMKALRSNLESEQSHESTLQIRAKLQELKVLIAETESETPLIDSEDYEIPN